MSHLAEHMTHFRNVMKADKPAEEFPPLSGSSTVSRASEVVLPTKLPQISGRRDELARGKQTRGLRGVNGERVQPLEEGCRQERINKVTLADPG